MFYLINENFDLLVVLEEKLGSPVSVGLDKQEAKQQTDIHQIKPTFNIGLIFLLRFRAVDHCSSVPPQAFFLQYFAVSLEADSEQDFLLRFNTLQQLSLS